MSDKVAAANDVIRKIQQMEGLLPLLDELNDVESVKKVATRICGIAGQIAITAMSQDFARAVLDQNGEGAGDDPCDGAPRAVRNFCQAVGSMDQRPFYYEGLYAGSLYSFPGMAETPQHATITCELLIARLIADRIVTLSQE